MGDATSERLKARLHALALLTGQLDDSLVQERLISSLAAAFGMLALTARREAFFRSTPT
jgi:hypothetical protein